MSWPPGSGCDEAWCAQSAPRRPVRAARPHAGVHLVSPDLTPTQVRAAPRKRRRSPRATQTPSRRAGMRIRSRIHAFSARPFVGVTPAGDDGERGDESRLDTKRVPANDSPRRRADCRARAESDVPRPSASPQPPRTERRPSQQTLAMSSQTFQAARATQARAPLASRARATCLLYTSPSPRD